MNAAFWTLMAAASLAQPQDTTAPKGGVEIVLDQAWTRSLGKARAASQTFGPKTDHSSWSNPWVIRTKSYELRMAGQRSRAVALAEAADSMLRVYESVLGTNLAGRGQLQIRVFPSTELYNEFGNTHSDTRSSIFGGYFDPQNAGGAAAVLSDSNRTLELMYLTHATAQQYLHAASGGRNLNATLTQGFSAYMQTFWNYGYFVDQFEANRDSGRLLDLGELLSSPLDEYSDRPAIRLNQLAMTFVYLRLIREDTRSIEKDNEIVTVGPFDQYLRKAIRGENLAGDPVEQLLRTQTAELQQEILDFKGWR